jgi:hypothetical protein
VPVWTLALEGDTETEIGAAAVWIITTALADFVGSVTDVTVTITGVDAPSPALPFQAITRPLS